MHLREELLTAKQIASLAEGELAYIAAADEPRASELDTARAKTDLLRRELDDHCKEIKAAGVNFHCRGALETQAGEEGAASFCGEAALLDLLRRELGLLRATCADRELHTAAGQ